MVLVDPVAGKFGEWTPEYGCVNPACRSHEIEPRAYVADSGMDVPRNPDGTFGGFVGTSASISGFNDVAGLLPDATRHPAAMPVENPTMLLAAAAAAELEATDFPRDGSIYDCSEMD